jgi:hypothetical protein
MSSTEQKSLKIGAISILLTIVISLLSLAAYITRIATNVESNTVRIMHIEEKMDKKFTEITRSLIDISLKKNGDKK